VVQALADKPSISALPAFFLIEALNFIVDKSKRYLVISKVGRYVALQYPSILRGASFRTFQK
jgi:hypothetical protein